MNVAIVSDGIFDYISGLTTFAKQLIEQLMPRVDKVVVITSGAKVRFEEHENLRVYYLKGHAFKKFGQLLVGYHPLYSLKRIFQDEQVHVVHCQSPSLVGMFSVRYARKLGIPVIFSSHFQLENLVKNMKIQMIGMDKVLVKYGKWLYGTCDHLVCPSEYAKKELLSYGLNFPERMTVISNGVDTKRFSPGGTPEKVILFVGRLMHEKCIDTLIRSSAIVKRRHPDYRTVIVGGGFLMSQLQALAAEVNPDVVFADKLPNEELIARYRSCALFVLPSEFELQGISLLEAMACGKPTIASDSAKSAAGDYANVRFRHRDHGDLADKICGLIEDPAEMVRLGRRNRETMVREHDYALITDQFLQLYRDQIERKAKEGGASRGLRLRRRFLRLRKGQ